MVTGVVDALESVTVKAAGVVPLAGSARVALPIAAVGCVGVGVGVGVGLATPLSCRPVTADPAAPVVAWNPNDVLAPAATWPFQAALVTT